MHDSQRKGTDPYFLSFRSPWAWNHPTRLAHGKKGRVCGTEQVPTAWQPSSEGTHAFPDAEFKMVAFVPRILWRGVCNTDPSLRAMDLQFRTYQYLIL
jgi:hypothetical protein